ncbi:hypothetical protein [Clostridium omnivorum]|uniref:Uncharacterized protein n=1 Tax=Clostridium omnivorum TaxID=1604902 RepID=A0ABQ5NAE0_9CLOT|nr:hypothetical protein [Clostridium sp. E14]GLC32180.1 hypothetical protein bsdE14_35900 [Clostridium sp. E14]
MYYQLLYLNDENEVTINEFETRTYDFSTEFAIVLFDNSKKPFAFIELEYSIIDKALGHTITLNEVISTLKDFGFDKLTSNKSAKKLREEVEKRTDICYVNNRTKEVRDYYNPIKDSTVPRSVYNLKIIDLKTKEELLFIENCLFNMENPPYRIIANGIKDYTIDYCETKEYEEECKLEQEKIQRQKQEEIKLKEQERIRAEATQLVREEETKRIEELIEMKIKELQKQESV